MRIYIDSNVLISYIKSEFGGVMHAQAAWTKQFLEACAEEKHTLVLSDWALFEIRKKAYYSRPEVAELLDTLGLVHDTTSETREGYAAAWGIREAVGIHHSDARHVQLALAAKCDCIVSWDTKDFKRAEGLIAVRTPLDFI